MLQRTVLLSSVDHAESMRKVASLYIQLPVDRFEIFKWMWIDDIVKVGYEASRGKLAAWWWERLRPTLPELVEVIVAETESSRCIYRG